MALSVTHTFVSAIADDPTASAAGEVLPSHWNASHTLTGQVDLTSQVTGILPAANGGTGTSTGYLPRTVNAQTGASYTIVASDIGKLVTTSNAAAIATTLPQATGSFGAGSILWIENKGAGTNTITPTTSTIDGSATLALTTNQGVTLVSDGTNWTTIRGIGGAGGGTPGGSNTQIQYNNTNAFAGSTHLTWDYNNLVLAVDGGTVVASNPFVVFTQTWNSAGNVFTATKINITNTASAAGSLIADWQVGAVSKYTVDVGGALRLYNVNDSTTTNYERGVFDWTTSANVLTIGTQKGGTGTGRAVNFVSASNTWTFKSSDGNEDLTINPTAGSFKSQISTNNHLILTSAANNNLYNMFSGTIDAILGGASFNCNNLVFAGLNGASAAQDVKISVGGNSGWNVVPGKFTILGPQADPSGTTNITGGNLLLQGGPGSSGSAGAANGGNLLLDGGTAFGTGAPGKIVIGSVTAKTVLQNTGLTVANLPTASGCPGAIAYVTDATATTYISTVAGGGSNKVMVFSNGTNWLIF